MDRYLCANFRSENGRDPLGNALWHYNHDNDYVAQVEAFALQYAVKYPELSGPGALILITLPPGLVGL